MDVTHPTGRLTPATVDPTPPPDYPDWVRGVQSTAATITLTDGTWSVDTGTVVTDYFDVRQYSGVEVFLTNTTEHNVEIYVEGNTDALNVFPAEHVLPGTNPNYANSHIYLTLTAVWERVRIGITNLGEGHAQGRVIVAATTRTLTTESALYEMEVGVPQPALVFASGTETLWRIPGSTTGAVNRLYPKQWRPGIQQARILWSGQLPTGNYSFNPRSMVTLALIGQHKHTKGGHTESDRFTWYSKSPYYYDYHQPASADGAGFTQIQLLSGGTDR